MVFDHWGFIFLYMEIFYEGDIKLGKAAEVIDHHRGKVAPLLILILVATISLMVLVEPKQEVTMEKFNQIHAGMTYDEVVSILGKGNEIDQPSLKKVNAKMYEWNNADGSGLSLVIKDGAVTTHMPYGLE